MDEVLAQEIKISRSIIMKLTKSKLRQIIREELLKEATTEKFGLKYNDEDHYVVHDSLRNMNDGVNGVGWSESWDVYGWKDQKNYNGAVKELNAVVLKIVSQYQPVIQKAKAKFEKEATNAYKIKDKIFKKWRKTDGSTQGS